MIRTAGLALGVFTLLALTPAARGQAESEDDLAFVAELAASFRSGGSYSAQRELEEYLLDFPSSATARTLAARVAFGRGRLEEASSHLAAVPGSDPVLEGRLLLRTDRLEQALALARGGALTGLAGTWLEVSALDALGRRSEARRAAREATDAVDDRTLDGHGLLDLGRLLLYQRRFELANQALNWGDAVLNGRRGPNYRLVEPEAPLMLGEVYVETRQSGQGDDQTLAVLNEVLAVDAGNPEALVGKAHAYIYGMNGRAAETALDQALTRDPNHPGALVLMGRTRLIDRRVDAAIALADQVLDGQPRHRGALALRAAALAMGDRETADAARERFETLHPESAELDRLLGEVLQSHYRFADSLVPLERALAIDPEDERPLPILAQSLAHLGRESDARAALEEHWQRSPFPYPWRNNMLAVLEKLEDAAEIVTEPPRGFRVRMPSAETDVLGPLLVSRLEAARADMAERWGVDPDGEVLVEVFDVHADFSVRTVGLQGFLALGACFGRVMTMLSPLSEMRGQFHWAQTAVHEYAHVVTLTLSDQRVPRWLTEGVSVVEEKKVDPSWARELERDVLNARANGGLLPIERLDEAFRDGSTVLLGYYQGSLICELIERDFGFDTLVALVASYADGVDTPEAIRRSLGVEPAELDRRLLAYVDDVIADRAAVRTRWTAAGQRLLRERLSAGDTDALIHLADAARDRGRRADEDAALHRYLEARGETAQVLRSLAERDAAAGRMDDARRRLESWAATEAVDADGLRLLASLQLRAGEGDVARATLWRAIQLFPGDVGPGSATAMLFDLVDPGQERSEHSRLLRSICAHDETALEPRVTLAQRALRDGDAETALLRYGQALEIDPYRPDLRVAYADVLADEGRTDEARRQWRLVLGMREGQMPGGGEPEPPGDGLPELFGHADEPDLDHWREQARKRLGETEPGRP